MTYYIRNGNTFRVTDERSLDISQVLPPSNYVVKYNEQGGFFYLEEIDKFTELTRYYGDIVKNATRIMNTYADRSGTTGVMLSGEKGSGKTQLAKLLSIEGYKLGYPTIIINTDFVGDTFNKFIQDIDQNAIILFDEFEKVFDSKKQEQILTLLDGTYPSKKLFVLTCNDKYRVDNHMRNRPGRIYYMLDFVGLSAEFIIEYCEENLINKQYITQIVDLASLYNAFNFDMLKALIEEMNRYDETPQQVLTMLNARPDQDSFNQRFKVKLDDVDYNILYTTMIYSNPLNSSSYRIEYGDNNEQELDITFDREQIVKIDGSTGTFVYLHPTGAKLTLTREVDKQYNYFKALL